MNTVKLMYVGNKPVKHDTICQTGAVWNGKGDIQEVSNEARFTENGRRETMTVAERLLKFPFVWVKATKEVIAAMEKSNALQEKADAIAKEAAEAQAEVDAAAAEAQAAVDNGDDTDVVGTVDEIKLNLPNLSIDEMMILVKSEKEGKNRKGMLKAIEAEIESR